MKIAMKSSINKIQLIGYDFDGVMTDNRVYIDQDGKEMVLIPGGSFEMGDHFNEGKSHELPGRRWN